MRSSAKTLDTTRRSRSLLRGLAMTTLALAASLPALAQEDLPPGIGQSVRCTPTGVDMTAPELPVLNHAGPRTRAEVVEQLRSARATNTITPATEPGDTQDVLDAREAFNALQAEVYAARVAAVQAHQQLASACERARTLAAQYGDEEPTEVRMLAGVSLGELMQALADEPDLVVLVVDDVQPVQASAY